MLIGTISTRGNWANPCTLGRKPLGHWIEVTHLLFQGINSSLNVID
jgi:hypothetical protein